MVKVKLHEVRDAFRGFQGVNLPDGSTRGGIGNAVLPPKAAYRVGRLVSKLKSELKEFEEAQRKLFRDAGAEQAGNALQLPPLERGADEDQGAWDARFEARRQKVNELNEAIEALLEEEVEIDYDALPLSIFENEKDGAKSAQLSPNDVALVGPFLKE